MSDEHFGLDLDLGLVPDEAGWTQARPWMPSDLQARRREGVAPRAVDVGTTSGVRTLVQALIVRLMTERGELAGLGYPSFGSRHHRLIGEPNTESNRALLKLYVLECLRDEPRLERVERLDVVVAGRADVEIRIAARMRAVPDVLNLVVPFMFEGGAA